MRFSVTVVLVPPVVTMSCLIDSMENAVQRAYAARQNVEVGFSVRYISSAPLATSCVKLPAACPDMFVV